MSKQNLFVETMLRVERSGRLGPRPAISETYRIKKRVKLDEISKKLGIKTQESWYSVTSTDIKRIGAENLFYRSTSSVYQTLQYVYPEFHWHPFLFRATPRSYWQELSNQRDLLDWIGEQLSVERQEDWYNFTSTSICDIGGTGLIVGHYSGSLFSTLKNVYPEFDWDPFRFQILSHTFTKDMSQRELLDSVAKHFGVEYQHDWYQVTSHKIREVAGSDFLKKLSKDENMFTALKAVYPEFEWQPLMFTYLPKDTLHNPTNQRKLLDWLADQLGIDTQLDWYDISALKLKGIGGGPLLSIYNGSLHAALQSVYSEFEWDLSLFQMVPHYYYESQKNQRAALDKLAEHLGIQRQEEWYSVTSKKARMYGAAKLINEFSNSLFNALQSSYPEFEWNPFQYKRNRWKRLYKLKNRRKVLNRIAEEWNIETYEDWYSLMKLKQDSIGGSPLWIVKVLKKAYPEFRWRVPPRTDRPALLLASNWNPNIDPTGYWMSEKFDGSRALWNGSKLISRLGQEWNPPAWFTEQFPTGVTWDGELWGGLGTYEKTSALVRSEITDDSEWKQVVFKVFDAPSLRHLPFEDRIKAVEDYLKSNPIPNVEVVQHERCNGITHLEQRLKEVEAVGGEGLMLRAPNSFYETKRSQTLLKVKSTLEAEARVIAHQPSESSMPRIAGLVCELPDGRTFLMTRGFSEQAKTNPPAIGTIITYRYYPADSGIPKFPAYKGIRSDVEWNDSGEEQATL